MKCNEHLKVGDFCRPYSGGSRTKESIWLVIVVEQLNPKKEVIEIKLVTGTFDDGHEVYGPGYSRKLRKKGLKLIEVVVTEAGV